MLAWCHAALSLAAVLSQVKSFDVPPTFTLDLSLAPEHRWDGSLAMLLSRHPYEFSFGPVFAAHNTSLFSNLLGSHFALISKAVRRHWPETAAELLGIVQQFAAVGHSEVSFEYLAAWLYFHELAHSDIAAGIEERECTGILTQSFDGSVLHGSNMDQEPMAARNLTLHIRAVDRHGELIFEGVDWYTLLSTGVSRAVRKGLASVQENWRHSQPRPLADVLSDIEDGAISQMLLFRRFFTTAHAAALAGTSLTFDDFVQNVTNSRLAAPFYIVAGGARRGQGVVIARDLTGAVDISRLGRPTENSSSDLFLCQCNTDRWLPDDLADPRRTAAETLLRRLGSWEGTTQLDLFAVMSSYPVHNPHTAYTAMMSAATGEFHAYIREAVCPVDPDASVVFDKRYCTRDKSKVLYT